MSYDMITFFFLGFDFFFALNKTLFSFLYIDNFTRPYQFINHRRSCLMTSYLIPSYLI